MTLPLIAEPESEDCVCLTDSDNMPIGEVWDDAYAQTIVLAVNYFDELVEALRAASKVMNVEGENDLEEWHDALELVDGVLSRIDATTKGV